MLLHDFKNAFHTLRNEKLNSGIAIGGLAIGLLAAFFLTSYCLYFFNYDRNVTNPDQWYRLRLTTTSPTDGEQNYSGFYLDTAGIMIHEIPAISDYIIQWDLGLGVNFSCDGKTLPIGTQTLVTPSFIDHYKLRFIYGDRDTLFSSEKNFIISESFSKRNFGNINPVGKVVSIFHHPAFIISGVFEDLPPNLHLRSDVYRKVKPQMNKADSTNDYINRVPVQVRIQNPADVPKVEQAFNALFVKNPFFGDTTDRKTVKLDPVTRIHYMAGLHDDQPTVNRSNFLAVMIIGILILLAAILNFLNLMMLSWQKRNSEFTYRRAVGAARSDILSQLLTEYLFAFLIAVIISLVLYTLVISLFANFVGLDLHSYTLNQGMLPLYTTLILLVAGFGTDLMAAHRFAGKFLFKEEDLYRNKETGSYAVLFIQTVIGFLFITLALLTSYQMAFIFHHNLGFDAKNTVQYFYVTLLNQPDRPQFYDGNVLRSRIRAIPGVIKESASEFSIAADRFSRQANFQEGKVILQDKFNQRRIPILCIGAASDFIAKRNIKLLQGRLPYKDAPDEVIINRTFAEKYFPHSSPLGSYLKDTDTGTLPDDFDTIVGVVDDVWYFPMHNVMPSLVYFLHPTKYDYYQITYEKGKKQEVISKLNNLFTEISKDRLLGFSSVDIAQEQKKFYMDDSIYVRLAMLFAFLIILISGMGIYAVSSLHIRRQMKDIAIRKVCGAEFKDLFRHYMKNYLLLIIAAGVTGLFVAYYLFKLFQDRFILHPTYPWFFYPISIAIVSALVLVPLYFNLLKAWKSDPNRYLQSE